VADQKIAACPQYNQEHAAVGRHPKKQIDIDEILTMRSQSVGRSV